MCKLITAIFDLGDRLIQHPRSPLSGELMPALPDFHSQREELSR